MESLDGKNERITLNLKGRRGVGTERRAEERYNQENANKKAKTPN